MGTLYKLTTRDNKTRAGAYNETLWGPGVSHKACGFGGLCSAGVIHAYRSPLIAVLLNPAHAKIPDFKLWKAQGNVVVERADKCGVLELTTIEELEIPQITTKQRVRFAQQAARWARKFADASNDAASAAKAASNAASYATDDAAYAANASSYVSDDVAYTADAASYAADAAAAATDAASKQSLDELITIAEWAITDQGPSALDYLMK